MQSDKSIYYTYKYLPFLFGFLLIIMPLLMYLNPETSTFNGRIIYK
jgi:hypothetical protein